MAKGGKQKRTETNEAGSRRGPGRPPLPEGERKKRKNAHDRESRATKKFERKRLETFAALPENIGKYEAFKKDYNKSNGESSKDAYVVKRPSSHGLEQVQLQHQISEMQAQQQWMVDNFDTMVQRSVQALLASYGFFQQTNAPTVSPAGPHQDPLSMPGGTNAAAGSSGDPTNQSSPHNEKFKLEHYKEFCGRPEIAEKFKAFREKYMASPKFQLKEYEDFCKEPGIADSFKDYTEKRVQFGEQLNMLEGPLMDGIDADALPNSPGQEMWIRSMMQRIGRMDGATEADNLEWTWQCCLDGGEDP